MMRLHYNLLPPALLGMHIIQRIELGFHQSELDFVLPVFFNSRKNMDVAKLFYKQSVDPGHT